MKKEFFFLFDYICLIGDYSPEEFNNKWSLFIGEGEFSITSIIFSSKYLIKFSLDLTPYFFDNF